MASCLLLSHLFATLTLALLISGISAAVGSTGKFLQNNGSSSDNNIRISSNAKSSSFRSRLMSSISFYPATGDVGEIEQCVGPTPPPGLTFPIETVVEKLFEADGPTTETLFLSGASSWYWTTTTYTTATTSYSTWTRQLTPQLNPYDPDRPCCGSCMVYVSLVDVYYWPVSGANTACLGSTALAIRNGPQFSTLTQGHNDTAVTTVGPDGFTYTSPSIYVAYHDISASNRCSQVGPKHTSITLSFAPGELSTLDYFSNIFRGPFYEKPKPFNISNLPCPPQSLLDAQHAADEIGFMLPARPGYAPIIAPPPAIQNLEPAWKWCYSQMAFDPPRSLVPAAILVPSPTPADQAGPQKTSATPSPTLDPIPVQTQLSNQPPTVYPLSKPNDPADPADPRVPPNDGPQPPNGNPNDPPEPSAPDPAAGSQNGGDEGKTPSTNINSPNNQGNFPAVSNNPLTQPDLYPGGPELSSNPFLDGTAKSQPLLAAPVITIGDQTLIALPKGGYSIADTTIQLNDPAITVHGTPISLGSAVLVVGLSTLSLETGSAYGVHMAGGVKYTQLDPGRLLLDGNTLSVNGPATIVSGNTVSLGSSGIVIAGQTFALSALAPEVVAPNTLTIAGQTITQLGSSRVLVDGVTLSVNGVGQTVHGTVLSLASSGIVINGQTYTIPTPAPDVVPRPDEVYTIADQTIRLLGSSSAIIDGMLISVKGPAETVSGKTISLVSSGIIVDGQSYPFPTLPLKPTSNAVVIDGTTLVAGGPAIAISGTTLSLVSGNAGLYLMEVGTASSAFSVPVTAEASMTTNAAGKLVEVGSSDTLGGGVNGGGLGSLIMLGFGQRGATSASNIGGGATASDSASNATSTAGLVAFTGTANKSLDLPVLISFSLALCVVFLAV